MRHLSSTIKVGTGVFLLVLAAALISGCTPSAPGTSQTSTPTTADTTQTAPSETAQYIAYSPQALKQAHFTGRRVILFFHASWCPTCKQADTDITNNLAQLPSDVTILKVNYDTETALKEKYGITYQHTFVQVDAQDNEMAKWNGGSTTDLLEKIK